MILAHLLVLICLNGECRTLRSPDVRYEECVTMRDGLAPDVAQAIKGIAGAVARMLCVEVEGTPA